MEHSRIATPQKPPTLFFQLMESPKCCFGHTAQSQFLLLDYASKLSQCFNILLTTEYWYRSEAVQLFLRQTGCDCCICVKESVFQKRQSKLFDCCSEVFHPDNVCPDCAQANSNRLQFMSGVCFSRTPTICCCFVHTLSYLVDWNVFLAPCCGFLNLSFMLCTGGVFVSSVCFLCYRNVNTEGNRGCFYSMFSSFRSIQTMDDWNKHCGGVLPSAIYLNFTN